MKAIIEEAEVDPEAWLKDIESRSQVKRTLCGNGQMVWHIWGEGAPIVFLHGGHGTGAIGAVMLNKLRLRDLKSS